MTDSGPINFAERRRKFLEERARERGENAPPPVVPIPGQPETPEWSESVQLPDLYDGSRSEEDIQLDHIINSITFPAAYNKWIGKSVAVQKKKDGNMISCPFPDHPDKNPSAWFDEDGKFNCGTCERGGDKYDLAAIHFGYPIPGYKEGALFHKLRQQMAESFGWTFKNVPGGQLIYKDEATTPPPVQQPPAQSSEAIKPPPPDATVQEEPEDSDNVSHMWADEEGPAELIVYPSIKWRNLVPEDTFLYEYMEACTNDDSPEEYHFWHGLLALGHAVGRKVILDDFRPVYGNLLVCLLGQTGTGKSRSRHWLDHVLREACPYHEDGTQTTGVKLIPVPSSGEYLVHQFSYEGKDPANGKASLGFQPVNGVVDFDEMSSLLSRANRQGSVIKPTIMALADANNEVKIGGLQRGDFIAREPFCSIMASTQPKAIRTLLSRTDTGSGFLNRWVFAGGKPKQTEVLGGSHSSMSIDLTRAIEELRKVRGWGGYEKSITLSTNAYNEFVRYYRTFLEPTKTKDDTDLLKRIDLLSKKLMLLLTINKRKTEVDIQTVQAVEALMEYVIECFGILNENIGITVMQDVINEIMRHIARHQNKTGRGASPRDIARYTHRKNYTLEQIKRALDTMLALDLIELDKKAAGPGRPTARYRMVGEA